MVKESPIEDNMSLYGKIKDNPFSEAYPDPTCKLSLKETSEFVMSLPTSNGKVTQGRITEAPSTPGRPVFSFSSSRKSFPSKWDDAEKWLMSSSCHDSPAHNLKVSVSSNISSQSDSFKQQMKDFAEKSRFTEERVSKVVPNFQRSASLDPKNAVGAFNAVLCPTDIVLKDKFTVRNFRYLEPTKEGFLFGNSAGEALEDPCTEVVHEVQHRDIGTEMTPLGSSTNSRCHTPLKISSPAHHNTPTSRSGPLALSNHHNTNCTIDLIRLKECHFSKLKLETQHDLVASNYWSSSEEDEEEISKSLRHNTSQKADPESRAATWEKEEKIKYQREEAKIQAWVNLQSANAEAKSRKLEVKIQKMRSNLEEKLMQRMSEVQRKAEERRATARQQHLEQIQKATERAQKMIHTHNSQYSRHSSCGCFPCNNNNY